MLKSEKEISELETQIAKSKQFAQEMDIKNQEKQRRIHELEEQSRELSLELDEVQKGKEEFAEKYLEAHEDNKVLRAKIMLDILQLDVRVVADDPSLLEEKQQADAQVERQKAQIEEMQEEGLNKDLQINELESQREQQANDIETLQLQLDESRIQCQQQEQQLDDLFKTQEIDTHAISDLQD